MNHRALRGAGIVLLLCGACQQRAEPPISGVEYGRALFSESLALLRAQDDRGNGAWALQALGEVAHEQGDPGARSLMEESLTLFRELGTGGSLRLEARRFEPIPGGDHRVTACFESDPGEKLFGIRAGT